MDGDGAEATAGFEALAHPTRMGVLWELFEANRRAEEGVELSFSELRDRVDAGDSGNFSYHLDQLVGLYLAKTGDGYRLTSRGFDVGLAMLSGTYSEGPEIDPIEGVGECLFCGAPLDARFEAGDGDSKVVCANGHEMHLTRLPTEAIEERSREEFLELVAAEMFAVVNRAIRGACAACRCPIDGDVTYDETHDAYLFTTPCDACGVQYAIPCGACALRDPEIVRFLHDRGADPWLTPLWEFDFCHLGAESVRSSDPLRIEVAIRRRGEERTVILDEDGSVREITSRR